MKRLLKSIPIVNILFYSYIILLLMINLIFYSMNINIEHRTFAYYDDASHNIVPFSSISNYFANFTHYNFNTWFYNTLGNIIMFIPLGVLIPIVYDRSKRLYQVVLLSFLISLIIEGMQFVTGLGVFDIDDIILNTIGGVIGFTIFKFVRIH
ncbi:glycopeptide antibiotics resistance protein [Alkalibacillus filiformis]|uniref:Glycopeptide antibiotics resistance protein n=1 Tax=Alkalibacillus filiformis TaxID=200990 RepID=A0ABU0DVX4_9BACI|nr:VanZ family protein [Alkalibacillus filiformis]MDQ0352505.1 glycopeptide antibiotics resistance protein [Alkalibacillus filiformis]